MSPVFMRTCTRHANEINHMFMKIFRYFKYQKKDHAYFGLNETPFLPFVKHGLLLLSFDTNHIFCPWVSEAINSQKKKKNAWFSNMYFSQQARTHQLLLHNKELIDHISMLVAHLQERERGGAGSLPYSLSGHQLTNLPQVRPLIN